MDYKELLQLLFAVIVVGNVLMHAEEFSSIVTAASSSYNGLVTTLQGR